MSTSSCVLVLDCDRDLGARVPEQDWELARSACKGRLVRAPAGGLDLKARDDVLGWEILQGTVCREVRLRDRYLFELLGPGDILQAPNVIEAPRLGSTPRLTAATEILVCVLGHSFIRGCAQWPGLLVAVHERLETQRQRLAIQGVINLIPKADHRLLLHLWHLAERWGRVTLEGTVLDLPLTHDLLGHLAGARRSTASIALGQLEDERLIRRLDDGTWLLMPEAERRVEVISRDDRRAAVLGETVRLRQRTSEVRAESSAVRAQARQIRGVRRSRITR